MLRIFSIIVILKYEIMKNKKTQRDLIKEHLLNGNEITPLEALTEFRCMRLAAVIFDLRKTMNIETEIVNDGDFHYAKYFIKK